jgi:hypothetical protein
MIKQETRRRDIRGDIKKETEREDKGGRQKESK